MTAEQKVLKQILNNENFKEFLGDELIGKVDDLLENLGVKDFKINIKDDIEIGDIVEKYENAVKKGVFNQTVNEVDFVGRLEDFGFDLYIILNNGNIYQKENWREITTDIKPQLNKIQDISGFFNSPEEEDN